MMPPSASNATMQTRKSFNTHWDQKILPMAMLLIIASVRTVAAMLRPAPRHLNSHAARATGRAKRLPLNCDGKAITKRKRHARNERRTMLKRTRDGKLRRKRDQVFR